jgi:3-phosphoshikimate 1-carboxyvinyltransferase
VIDAQFTREPAESPLARWAMSAGVPYLSGASWWREQARLQDSAWFGPDRLGQAQEGVLSLVPASKSETLRALAIAAAFGLPAEIRGPALNEDTEVFVRAIEALGVSVDYDGATWRVFPPQELRPPSAPIDMGEGATGLRILGALSTLMSGTLKVSASGRLQERPQDELLAALGGAPATWPLEIPCGRELPQSVSLERSSQFASGFLIAGAAAIHKGRIQSYELKLEGESRSLPYLQLTLLLLRECGIASELEGNSVKLTQAEKKRKLTFTIEKDASSLAFLEVYARRWKLASLFQGTSRQGDGEFPILLDRLLAGESRISLRHHPDLAPPLWAAAALFRLSLEVRDCPQLRLKESDRVRLLVEAAAAIGGAGEERPDGFKVDFTRRSSVRWETFLRTDGDHRIAMAAGLLQTDEPLVAPDRKDCVRKSFPHFWHALAALEEALPG